MRRVVFIFPILVFAVVGVFLAYGLTRDPSSIPSQLIDKPLPDFDLPPIEGFSEGLSTDDIKGEVALLNVFGSWCVSCRIEHPVLMKLSEANEIPIYGLNWKDKPGDGAAWLQRHGNPYLLVGDDEKGRVAIDLGVTGAPETFVIDREGRVRFKVAAPITEDYWTYTLQPVIEELRK